MKSISDAKKKALFMGDLGRALLTTKTSFALKLSG